MKLSICEVTPTFPWSSQEKLLIAGPCAIENEESLDETAQLIWNHGWKFLRGGAFKPRTSPYSFQGLGEKGLQILQRVSKKYSLYSISEVLSEEDVSLVAEYVDVLQIGARNSQNTALLKKVGKFQKPILLKRGMMMRLEELLLAAEYIAMSGNSNIILCERGIRTFETAFRNTLDLSAIPYLKEKTKLPIIVDPSHATGNAAYVPAMTRAALAAGADGVMIEVHKYPEQALSDGNQALTFEEFFRLKI